MNKSRREALCHAYLGKMTIAHAIPRISECVNLNQFEFKAPILDIGCGDGVFSGICFGTKKIDVGLDPQEKALRLTKKSGVYKDVVLGSGEKIPFKNNYFGTVFSNSVLEHVENTEELFKEVYRVLKKGGNFIFIVPDKSASDFLFFAEILEKIKLKNLAKKYIRFKNRLYRYAHLEEKDFWEKLSSEGGFGEIKIKGFFSPEAVRAVDFFSPTAMPDYFLRKIFGRSFIFRPNFTAKIITPFILKYCEPLKNQKATAWVFELTK